MTHFGSTYPGVKLHPPQGAFVQYWPVNPLEQVQMTSFPFTEQVPLFQHGFGLQLDGGDGDDNVVVVVVVVDDDDDDDGDNNDVGGGGGCLVVAPADVDVEEEDAVVGNLDSHLAPVV